MPAYVNIRVGTLVLKPKLSSGILSHSLKEVCAMVNINTTPNTNRPIRAALFL
jgi:hypothetical protein